MSLSTCLRKLRHIDYLSALLHAERVPRNETVVIYPCEYCGGLHVGHSVMAPPKNRELLRKLARTEQRIARAAKRLKSLAAFAQEDEAQRERQRLKDLHGYLESLKSQVRFQNTGQSQNEGR